jgi:hypothetical protein
MASALRLKLHPFPTPPLLRTTAVEGLRLELLRRGSGTSKGQPGSKVDCELEFHFAKVADPLGSPGAPTMFASLKGQLELRGPSKQPFFINGLDGAGQPGLIEYVEPLVPEVRPADRSRPVRKAIRLDFDLGSFEQMNDPLFTNTHLVLPKVADDVLFIEIGARLTVGGAAEAETDQNDRLDIVLFGGIGALVPTTSVGFRLGFADDSPPPAPTRFKLEDPEGRVLEGKTNARGEGFVDGVAPGESKLTLLDFAPVDFGGEPKAGAAGTQHKVAKFEDVPQIAAKKGYFDPAAIHADAANESLATDRPNLNQLVEGDQLTLPPKESEPLPARSGILKAIILASRPVQRLRIQLQADVGFSYVLKVGTATFRGDHEGSALIEHEVPALSTKGNLKVTFVGGAPPLEWALELGTLEPATTIKGQQARLMNLGFDPQGVDGKVGKNTKAATTAFQTFVGLEPSGELDEATVAELEKRHDEAGIDSGSIESGSDADSETAVA